MFWLRNKKINFLVHSLIFKSWGMPSCTQNCLSLRQLKLKTNCLLMIKSQFQADTLGAYNNGKLAKLTQVWLFSTQSGYSELIFVVRCNLSPYHTG